jgi:hypothetical protein
LLVASCSASSSSGSTVMLRSARASSKLCG